MNPLPFNMQVLLSPAVQEAISGLDIPQLLRTINSNLTQPVLVELAKIADQGKQELTPEKVQAVFARAQELSPDDVKLAAGLGVVALLILFPGAAVVPLLNILGFTGVGPAAGSVAAAIQSKFGVSALFSIFQSAGMGGYGVAIVNGIVQAGAAVAGGTGVLLRMQEFWRNLTQG